MQEYKSYQSGIKGGERVGGTQKCNLVSFLTKSLKYGLICVFM